MSKYVGAEKQLQCLFDEPGIDLASLARRSHDQFRAQRHMITITISINFEIEECIVRGDIHTRTLAHTTSTNVHVHTGTMDVGGISLLVVVDGEV